MNYLSVELSCKLQSCALFPPYQGSMLRGLLGHNLRRAVCVTHKEDCLNCLLGRTCIFTKLFSLAPKKGENFAPKLAPPFCLELPLKSLGNLSSGEIFSFGLILFGYAVEYLPFFVQAFIMGEESGLGQKTKDGFGRYKLISVKSNTAELYLAQKEQLKAFEASELKLPKLGNKEEEGELCLNLLTPLRFKQANHLGQRLEFSTLLQLILRRERALLALEGQDFALDPLEFATLKQEALAIKLKNCQLSWHEIKRYSNHQHTSMQLGGLTGTVLYQGKVQLFKEWLELASKVHLGKQTSFGLGQISYSYI